ncbi:MAG: class B sortase [Bacillota bacterium]|nr:class B sortase [Bacillota bacterium]
MKQHIRKLVIVVLALVFVLSAAMTVIRTLQYRSADQAAQDAQDLVGLIKPLTSPDPLAEDSYAKTLFGLDFSSLTAINDEVIGWILVPGTELSQPILKGIDNQYYLSHNWRNEYNPSGAVFMEELCTPDFSDFNTILYAHRMNNDSMFGFLKYYQNEAYLQAHLFSMLLPVMEWFFSTRSLLPMRHRLRQTRFACASPKKSISRAFWKAVWT